MYKLKLHQLAVVFCLLFGQATGYSQKTPYLEKSVTIKVYSQTFAEVFKLISAQTDVIFSYTQFNDQQKVTAIHFNKPLRFVLNDLLKDLNCTYKMKGKYVILQCSDQPKKEPEEFKISGYVYNSLDSSRVDNASIYVKESRRSATTNAYGYFSFSFPKTGSSSRISIAKEHFRDTVFVVSTKNKLEVSFFIAPKRTNLEMYASIDPIEVQPLLLEKDTVPVAFSAHPAPVKRRIPLDTSFHNALISGFHFWEKLKAKNLSLRNINDTLFQNVSFSLVPAISTNRLLSINTVNKFSFNLLAGESKGVDGFEFGALVNIDNGDVRYGQFGGLVNVVSGNVLGGQMAGLVNYNGGSVYGGQLGGLTNIVRGNVAYGQIGGLVNAVEGTVTGAQIAGLVNAVDQDVFGLQVAGLINADDQNVRYLQSGGIGNIVAGKFHGIQIGGIFNANHYTGGLQVSGIVGLSDRLDGIQVGGLASESSQKLNGIQIAGLSNSADTLNGLQISGLVNNAKRMNGFQLAGMVNVAKEMNGVQLSVFNFSRTSKGVPIGFFSYVHKGYHKIEIAADEMLFGTLAFRTGINAFHNIFISGISMQKPNNVWTYGYGLGSAIKVSKKWYIDLDVTAQQLQSVKTSDFYMNALGKVFLGAEVRPFEKFNIAFGPTFNVLASEISDNNLVPAQLSVPHLYNFTEDNIHFKMWVGAKVCLRFL